MEYFMYSENNIMVLVSKIDFENETKDAPLILLCSNKFHNSWNQKRYFETHHNYYYILC